MVKVHCANGRHIVILLNKRFLLADFSIWPQANKGHSLPFSIWLSFCHWSDVIRPQPSLSDLLLWLDKVPFWGQDKPLTAPGSKHLLGVHPKLLTFFSSSQVLFECSAACFECVIGLLHVSVSFAVPHTCKCCWPAGTKRVRYSRGIFKAASLDMRTIPQAVEMERPYVCKTFILLWLHANQSHCRADVLFVDQA